jgi:hypothetical protein
MGGMMAWRSGPVWGEKKKSHHTAGEKIANMWGIATEMLTIMTWFLYWKSQ